MRKLLFCFLNSTSQYVNPKKPEEQNISAELNCAQPCISTVCTDFNLNNVYQMYDLQSKDTFVP